MALPDILFREESVQKGSLGIGSERSQSQKDMGIRDREVVQAIDLMTFDQGDTETLVGSRSAETSGKDVRKNGDAKESGRSRELITP